MPVGRCDAAPIKVKRVAVPVVLHEVEYLISQALEIHHRSCGITTRNKSC